jgi:transposase
MEQYQQYVGVDVSARNLSVSADARKPFLVTQTPAGWSQMAQKLKQTGCMPGQTLIVMEATGPYSLKPAMALHKAGFAVSIINPLKSHYFAKSLLQNAKSDNIDAQLLARYGAQFKPAQWTPPPPIHRTLYVRLVQRETLIDIRQQLRNQRYGLERGGEVAPEAAQRLSDLLDIVQKQVNATERELRQILHADTPWRENAQLLLSIKGVGVITAAWLLVVTQNFAFTNSSEELAAYCGLVPHVRQSGHRLHSKRRVRFAGSKRLRRTLYLATMSGAQCNPILKEFYQGLRARGKPMKVARIATARKLAHLVWGVVSKGQPFDADYLKRQPVAA